MASHGWRVALLCAFLSACTQLPVTDEMVIEPSKGEDAVVVTVSTRFMLGAPSEAMRARVDAARSAALANNDPWSVRFSRLTPPEEERVTYDRQRGALEKVTRSALVPADDLQQLLADANITVDVLRGDGWRELTFYPGTSARASREQQAQFERELAIWSGDVARYFTAIHHLYRYLDEQPHREEAVFAALVADERENVLAEEEQPLVEAVVAAMADIAERMDAQEGSATTFAEQADLIFNPFPARIVVRVPDVLSSEGFAAKGNELAIERADLFAAIAELEGKWITPDPLAALLREEAPTAAQLAEMPRRSAAVVSASEIARAVREQLARPKRYSVRWRE